MKFGIHTYNLYKSFWWKLNTFDVTTRAFVLWPLFTSILHNEYGELGNMEHLNSYYTGNIKLNLQFIY